MDHLHESVGCMRRCSVGSFELGHDGIVCAKNIGRGIDEKDGVIQEGFFGLAHREVFLAEKPLAIKVSLARVVVVKRGHSRFDFEFS